MTWIITTYLSTAGAVVLISRLAKRSDKFGIIAALAIMLTSTLSAYAANTPCSGSKGGIDHCAGGKFVCNNGSISASKQFCSMPGSGLQGLFPPQKTFITGCDCRSGAFCTGPRGGTFCYSDSGKKSYVRK